GAHWIALLGAAGGLVVLAGDPRAVCNDAIVAVIYLAARCWREREALRRALGGVAAGVALAVAAGAAQWLPGLAYLHTSQRSVSTLVLFGYYSLGWNNLPLLAVPYLIGGNGNFAMPVYAGSLNMPEVTYAVGILPLVALFALLPRLLRRGRRTAGRDDRQGLAVWYVMFLVGAVLTTGARTPLGHLLVHVPLYGGQRDQNRNAAIADFALASLLAIFVDSLRASSIGAATSASSSLQRLQRWAGAVPAAAVVGLVLAMFAWTRPMERWLGVTSPQPRLPLEMAGYYAVAVLIALGALYVLARRTWRSTESRRRAAATVVLADVLVFVVMASYQAVPLSALAERNPPLSALLARLPPGSRIAIDDPDQLALDDPPYLTDKLGVNDLVLLHALASVQGYGSAVPAAYGAATGTHDVENLLPAALLGSTFDDLDLGVVVVVPEQFGTIVPNGEAAPIPPGPPLPAGTSAADRQPGGVARAPYPPAGPWRLGPAGTDWQLPAPAVITAVTLAFDRRYGPLPSGPVSLSVRLADGRSLGVTGTLRGGTDLVLALPAAAVRAGGGALAVAARTLPRAGTAAVVGAVVVDAEAPTAPLALHQPSSGTVRYALNGLLQGLLTPPHWTYAGHIGPLVLYRDNRARGEAWLEAPGARAASAPSVAGAVSTPTLQPWQDAVTMVQSPTPALLVRSEQYSPGWSVTLQPVSPSGATGRPSSRPVEAVGLLQGVEIPAGRYRLTWHYHSGRAEIGLFLSGAGWVASAGLGVAGLKGRRRRLRLAGTGR
ncbi:MAG TPA: hypothetical protein VEH29_17930, partial [Acidimicrobiales bacterium]|nr:hypothetical protein [Acidimicrobiales bacterium]